MPNINNVPTTQYIGPRIIPHFAEPSEWSITREYDALSIVTNGGNTYWAKTNVPAGIQITNTTYWYLSAYPDAQIQQYRAEVQAYAAEVETFDGRIDTLEGTASTHTQQIASLDGRLDDAEDEIDALKTPHHAVFIGDSFTSAYYLELNGAAETARWCYPVARFLRLTPHIYAERGAGYKRASSSSEGGHTFRGMLDLARLDTSFNNALVDYLFVYGGLNDIDHEDAGAAFSTEFSTFCTQARSAFPNAHIVVCGINAWPESLSLYDAHSGQAHQMRSQIFYEQTMKTQNAFINANCSFISMCGALGFKAANYYTDNRHPNVLGNEAIATWIICCLEGSNPTTSFSGALKSQDGTVTGGNFNVHFHPGAIEVFVFSPSTMSGLYIADDFNIMRDQALDLRGVPFMYIQANQPIFGYLGSKDTANEPYGYVNTTNYGYAHFVRLF